MNLKSSLQYIKGIGEKHAKRLEKLSIKTINDFIYYFPRQYDDRRTLPKLNKLPIGENIQAHGRILEISEKKIKQNKCPLV